MHRNFYQFFDQNVNLKLRKKRFEFFISLLNEVTSNKPLRILDVGGEPEYWERMNYAVPAEIILLNLDYIQTSNKRFINIKGDGCDLSVFKDKEFDIVFSNSVIEHLFTKERQKKMADEVRRVGKYYYVQTPNFYFPIEPHWYFPFFQFFPFRFKVNLSLFLTRYLKWPVQMVNNKEDAFKICKEVRLLTEKEMRILFPEGKVYKEFYYGLKKSITLYHFPKA